MRLLVPLLTVLILIACSDEAKRSSQVHQQKKQWPSSKEFRGNGNSFTISLTKEFNKLAFKRTDTVKTIYDKALQDVYVTENDTLSLIISIGHYTQEITEKRKTEKIIESAINSYLYALQAKKSISMECSKTIKNSIVQGERTFYSLIDGMTRYYGASEMYVFNGKLFHIAILSTSKDAFTQSQSIALAFHSFMPQ